MGFVRYWVWLALLGGGAGGCASTWRPPVESVQAPAAHDVIDLARYTPADPTAGRIFRRSDPRGEPGRSDVYVRRNHGAARAEGLLADKTVTDLAAYLGPDAVRAADRWQLWPEDAQVSGSAFFLEFDPPLVHLPAKIEVGLGFSQRVRLRYFDRDGKCTRRGSVTRTIEFQGYESVAADGRRYEQCARLKIDTRLRIRWGPRVNIVEYAWLAPGIGEVRRTELFSGLAYLVHFNEVHIYELLNIPPPATEPVATSPWHGEAWARCAVFLDQLMPHPRLGGLIVELDETVQTASAAEGRDG